MSSYYFEGMRIIEDRNLTDTHLVIDNHSRFVEYDKNDYEWLLKFGIARIEEVPSKKTYMVEIPNPLHGMFLSDGQPKSEKVWLMHPVLAKALRQEIEQRNRDLRWLYEVKPSDFIVNYCDL